MDVGVGVGVGVLVEVYVGVGVGATHVWPKREEKANTSSIPMVPSWLAISALGV